MRIAFLNPQGNFDAGDSYWTEHPDFGGQLVYVKELSLALGRLGHSVDILTRRIIDASWHGFESELDAYPGAPQVRIVRLPCGGECFLRKEKLWPCLGTEWVPNIQGFYRREGTKPDAATAHYGDGGLAAAIWQANGGPRYTFTAHSLGAQKLDRLLASSGSSLAELDAQYHFARRLVAERLSMNHAAKIITSTRQEQMEQYSHRAYDGAVDAGDECRFAVIPPGVNTRIFGAEVQGPDDDRVISFVESMLARDIDGSRLELPAVICSSRLDPKKNHVGLVQAFATNPELLAASNLLIIVRGAEDIHSRAGFTASESAVLDEIVAVCERHNLWGKISAFSLESQAELAAAYRHLSRRRSVFALTALYEPFGLAPLEAMAAGLPALVTCEGGPSESLYDENTGEEFGVLVDPKDPGKIAAGLLRLVGSQSEWTAFEHKARHRVLSRYTWERTAAGYLEVIEQAVARRLPIAPYFLDPRPGTDLTLEWPLPEGPGE